MSFDEIATQALRMSLQERALLASSLWESIADPFEVVPKDSDEEVVAIALERGRQVDSGEVLAISHSDLMARLRQ